MGQNKRNSLGIEAHSQSNNQKHGYNISKKVFWPIVVLSLAIFITLLVLTIYFGVNQKKSESSENTTPTGTAITTTSTSSIISPTTLAPPVERVPTNLEPSIYNLTIEPNLALETFSGYLLYTFKCLQQTDVIVLHMKDLTIDNSSIEIVSSLETQNSLPNLQNWTYDFDNELMKIKFSSFFSPNNSYILSLNYTGIISNDLHGLYVSRYTNSEGIDRTFMTSQMEPTHARNVLPCVDEPARKAIFHISVIHDRTDRVWGNGECYRTTLLPNGKNRTDLAETVKMSTFLLALIVAPDEDFACRSDRIIPSTQIKSRVCGRKDILPQLEYADQVGYEAMIFFNDYFNITYPLPKIEHFAVPDFGAGAMENYGLLIYREIGLFFDERTVSAARKQYITTVISHEVAHQWFGNLVSPAWWGELWLKEGFASYMETLASDYIEPLWMQGQRFVAEKIFSFIEADSLPTSRPISIQSTNPADIFLLFDVITYDKGATLIRMMSMFLDPGVFQQGLRNYLRDLSYESATQEDLWRYLSAASNNTVDVEKIMNGWTKQAGYPVVEVQRSYGSSKRRQKHADGQSLITITQQRFSLFSNTTKTEQWWIPFKYFDKSSIRKKTSIPIIWLNSSSTEVSINLSDSDWLLANPDYLGIYRTKYDERNFRLIIDQLMLDHTRIPAINRGALIDDAFALSRASLIDTRSAYELIRYLKDESDYVPWSAAFSAMRLQEDLLSGQEILLDVQRYFLELVLPLYNKLGWSPINQSVEWLPALLQPSVISATCRYGNPECIDEARNAFRRWSINPSFNQIPATFRSTVYCTVVREGTQKEFYFLWDRLKQETVASETLNLLSGLACTKDQSLIRWFLNQHIVKDPVIRDQDIGASIQRVARSSQGNQLAWDWIRDNWNLLFNKWGRSGSVLSGIIEAVSSRFVTKRQIDDFIAFSNSIPDKGTTYRQFQLSLDKINAAFEWNNKNLQAIEAFLHPDNLGPQTTSHRLPALASPIHYDLYVRPYLNITDSHLRFSIFEGQVDIALKILRTTDRVVLHKRFISVESVSATSDQQISVVSTTFDHERDFYTIIFNKNLTQNQHLNLSISYIGELRNDTYGFYLSSYIRSSDNVRRYLVASQMEPIAARRALPCFDEPALKATYTITVEHEQEYRVWSNMPVESYQQLHNGWAKTTFQKSVPMSSYLLALVVADFECVTRNNTGYHQNITTSICARPEKKTELNYALQVASRNIMDFEQNYGVNFPITKVDHIAVPDFDAGAMENFGCIIYRETRLFYNNVTSTSTNQQEVALVIVHELAHQWFGDLVSPAWWDDLWLNEGFAKWMEFVYTDKIHPEWELYEQFISQRWLAVMQNDAISFSHPINMRITQNDQLTSIFDSITYSKGSSLLRMMRNFMGSTTFDRGVSNYLKEHIYSTATQNDLWEALGEQMINDGIQLPPDTTLAEIMSTWTDQMGYPYIQVTRNYSSQTIDVIQKQFLFDVDARPSKSPHDYIWSVPLKIRNRTSTNEMQWLLHPQMKIPLQTSSNDWILANPELMGFFRTNYDMENWGRIIAQLKTDHKIFSVTERAGLIDDAFNLARPNIIPSSLIFELLEYSANEESYIVWERILSGFSYVEKMIASSSTGFYLYERLRSYMVDLIYPIYTKLGWNDKPSTDKWLDALHREMIITAACYYGLENCTKHAESLFEQWFNTPSNNRIPANQRRVVYCTSIALGDRARFQFLLREYQASNDPQEKARIQMALTCTREIELIRYLLEIHIETERNIIRSQDVLTGIRLTCRNVIAEFECWNFIKSRWSRLFRDYGGSLSFAELIKDTTARFNTESQLLDFEKFTEQTKNKGAAETEFKASIERIRANIQWIKNSRGTIEEWFLNKTLAIRLPLDWFPSIYDLHFDVKLQVIYPNNTAPDKEFSGDTRIRIQCRRSTDELRVHMKSLLISHLTLKKLGSDKNLISDWTVVTPSEIILCRLRERCVQGEEYELESRHKAYLDTDMGGFYLSQYTVTNPVTEEITIHNIAATHMQPTIARRVFPCFDEPLFKANFTITITYDPSFTVVRSNGDVLDENQPETLPNGRLRSKFETTPAMSTYLVAFVLTDFQCITNASTENNIRVSVCGRAEAINNHEGAFALDVGINVLRYFEQSYDVPYPLRKCDHFAIPDFSAGAMENWGLITYRETALLYNPDNGNLANKLRVGEVVSHEVAHQWFGNIVTPKWWNDVWLNEGFASWVEILGLNNVNPEFRPLDVFVVVTLQRALIMDSLQSSHPISVEVTHPDEINSIFDAITYDKGASILRMIYQVMTESTFYRGVSNYLKNFIYSNAAQDDLWSFLTNVTDSNVLGGYSIKQIMETWTLQEGYPVLMVNRNYENNSVTLTQKRFLLDPKNQNQLPAYKNPFQELKFQWYIPYDYYANSQLSPFYWLPPNKTEVIQNIALSDAWVLFNVKEFGFYRVNYDQRNWNLLIDGLNSNLSAIPVISRAQLIDDAFNLARSGDLNISTAFEMTKYLRNEIEYLPFGSFSSNVQYALTMFGQNEESVEYQKLQSYVRQLEAPIYEMINWTAVSSSSDYLYRQLASLVISDLCANGYNACIVQANAEYDQWRKNPSSHRINPDFRMTFYCQAIKSGTKDDFDFILSQYKKTNDQVEKNRYGYALTCTKNETLLQQLLNDTLKNEYIRLQDSSTFISRISAQPKGKALAWQFIKHRWAELVSKMGGLSFTLSNIVEGVLQFVNTETELNDVEAFMAETKDLSIAERAFQSSIEKIRANIRWMDTIGQDISVWLSNNTVKY